MKQTIFYAEFKSGGHIAQYSGLRPKRWLSIPTLEFLDSVYKVQTDASASSGALKNVKIETLLPDWEIFCSKLAREIENVKNVNGITNIRNKLYCEG